MLAAQYLAGLVQEQGLSRVMVKGPDGLEKLGYQISHPSVPDNMDVGTQERNAKLEKGQAAETVQWTSGSSLHTFLTSRHTCNSPILESRQQAGKVTDMRTTDNLCFFTRPTVTGTTPFTASRCSYHPVQCPDVIVLQNPLGPCLCGNSPMPQMSAFTSLALQILCSS